MKVMLRSNEFTATQWFKDGDHPRVMFNPSADHTYGVMDKTGGIVKFNTKLTGNWHEISPGMWIVEMHDGIHLYRDEEFKLSEEDCE